MSEYSAGPGEPVGLGIQLDNFVGEIRIFAGTFAPVDWVMCAGQLLPIAQYDLLFNLIGTTYGGDGQSTFAVPDLRGRIPLHYGSWAPILGDAGGVESVTLTGQNAPPHPHTFYAQTAFGNNRGAVNQALSKLPAGLAYNDLTRPVTMVSPAASDGGQAHENRMPILAINFIIATTGIWPSPF